MPCVELTRFGPVKTVQAARLAVGHLYVRGPTPSSEPGGQAAGPFAQVPLTWAAALTGPRLLLLPSDPENFAEMTVRTVWILFL